MAERVELIYGSADGTTQIHAVEWLPEERAPKAVLQIVHGMQEYIGRYDAFARYLADRGFIVVGEDHLGHGETAVDESEYGYFAKDDAANLLVKNVHHLYKMIHEENKSLPYFMYGFSMGSFIARKYLSMYGEGLDGAIIGGTGWQPNVGLQSGKFLARVQSFIHGDHYRSPLITKIAFGEYTKKIEHPRTPSDWICSDEAVVDQYVKDPMCRYLFTTNGFYTLFDLIQYVQQPENAKRVPPNLPVLFMSGMLDPVGDYGEGVKKSAELYMRNGMTHVELKLYQGMRHEVHNEKMKHLVYLDVLEWLENQM